MIMLMMLFLGLVLALLTSAGVFHALARMGRMGRAINDFCARAPALDVIVFGFVHGPWCIAWGVWWWHSERSAPGFVGYFALAVLAQATALVLWSWLHEAMNPRAAEGSRIVTALNRAVGPVRNHAAVWCTAIAVPVFTLVRIAELTVYPALVRLVRFPRYPAGDWVNVSRQKFEGLVGWDLIWCLYCDWMTGVWSLGSEMLRNVESFWCPIRFASPEKCKNCRVDFPDVDGAWVRHTGDAHAPGTLQEVADLLQREYPGPGGVNSWFGHPARLTIRGRDASEVSAPSS